MLGIGLGLNIDENAGEFIFAVVGGDILLFNGFEIVYNGENIVFN